MPEGDNEKGRRRILSALLVKVGTSTSGWFPKAQTFRIDHYDDIESLKALQAVGALVTHNGRLAWTAKGLQMALPDPIAEQELRTVAHLVEHLERRYKTEPDHAFNVALLQAALS